MASAYTLCGMCGTSYEGGGDCPACAFRVPLKVVEGYILEFPAGTVPCPGCGSDGQTVRFRGWVRLMSFVIWAQEMRIAAYVCADCGRKETAKALTFSALLGWLSITSWFFYGWRATYMNWRSVWAAPNQPEDWGAINAAEFAAEARAAQEDAFAEADADYLENSPLRFLSAAQQSLVLSAEGLYERLGVASSASSAQIRAAYRARCKENHPDLNAGASAETMIALNKAWEVLRDSDLRTAYDWLQAERAVA